MKHNLKKQAFQIADQKLQALIAEADAIASIPIEEEAKVIAQEHDQKLTNILRKMMGLD